MSIVTKITFIYNNRLTSWMVLGLIGTMFNGVPFSRSISLSSSRTPYNNKSHLSRPPFSWSISPFFIKDSLQQSNLSSWGHVFRRWRNRFNSNRWNTRHCSVPTTARDTAMLDPCELGAYARIPLRCIGTHVDFWKSRGSQRWIQDVSCLLRIRKYWRSKDTWEYGVWATRRKPLVDYGWGW